MGLGQLSLRPVPDLDIPEGLAFDSNGNLYVANYNDTILKFNSNGVSSVFASTGLNNPGGLAFDSKDNLYVANYGNNTIEKFNPSGAGSLFSSTNALFEPIALTFDSSGNLYVANRRSTGSILEFDPEGDMSVFASGFGDPAGIVDDIPEPSPLLLAALGALSLIAFLKRKRA